MELLPSRLALKTMDRESAVWQLSNMFWNPTAVYRLITTHKHTKGKWSRDDPAFLLSEICVVAMVGFFWYLSPFTSYAVGMLIRTTATFVGIDLIVIGLVVSLCLWVCLNRFCKKTFNARHVEEDIEWRYCFDVYANAFVAVIVDIDVCLLLVSLVRAISDRWIFRVFLGNAMMFVGVVHFVFIAVPMIHILPFVTKHDLILFIAPIVVIFLSSLLFSIDAYAFWHAWHFGWR